MKGRRTMKSSARLTCTAMAVLTAAAASAVNLFQQQLPGTEDKWGNSDTDLFEPLQWDMQVSPGDGDSPQLAAYTSDKRFHLVGNHSAKFEYLYFKTGHSAVDTGSNLRFDTRDFYLLYPSATNAY